MSAQRYVTDGRKKYLSSSLLAPHFAFAHSIFSTSLCYGFFTISLVFFKLHCSFSRMLIFCRDRLRPFKAFFFFCTVFSRRSVHSFPHREPFFKPSTASESLPTIHRTNNIFDKSEFSTLFFQLFVFSVPFVFLHLQMSFMSQRFSLLNTSLVNNTPPPPHLPLSWHFYNAC